MRRVSAALLILIVASLLAPITSALAANASLPDLEDEVMCTICGTTLQLSNSPQAERERVFINKLIAEGKDKDQIKAALVDEYGSEVLAVPSDSGFDLVGGWILPAVGILAGATAVGMAAFRWRRRQRDDDDDDPTPVPALGTEDDRRLNEDLGRYDA
jgi:cytochrome c-type biogenesis protein CcmH